MLPRYDGLLLRPYLLISFETPFASATDRAMAALERDQPQTLRITTRVIGGHPTDVEIGNNAVVGRLMDWSPNPGSTTDLRLFASGSGETRERRYLPPRSFERVNWRCTLNAAS